MLKEFENAVEVKSASFIINFPLNHIAGDI